MTAELRQTIAEQLSGDVALRRTRVLKALSIATSSWYRQPIAPEQRRRPGPPPRPIAESIRQDVVAMAVSNPWYGYKRIAVMCRRAGQAVQDRQAYVVMRQEGLLHKPRPLTLVALKAVEHAIDMARYARSALAWNAARLVQHEGGRVFVDDETPDELLVRTTE